MSDSRPPGPRKLRLFYSGAAGGLSPGLEGLGFFGSRPCAFEVRVGCAAPRGASSSGTAKPKPRPANKLDNNRHSTPAGDLSIYGIANVLALHAPESNALSVGHGAASQLRQKAAAAAGHPRAERGQSARRTRHGAGLPQTNFAEFPAKFAAGP